MTQTVTVMEKQALRGDQSGSLPRTVAAGLPLQTPAVLVVDDDEHFRALARALLSPNFEVEEASSVADCIKRLGSRSFDAVMLDVVMPDQDGIAAIREIRARAPGTRIVAISGSRNSDLYLMLAEKLGAHAALAKASIEEVRSLLGVVLHDRDE